MTVITDYFSLVNHPDRSQFVIRIGSPVGNQVRGSISYSFPFPHTGERLSLLIHTNRYGDFRKDLSDSRLIQLCGLGLCAKVYQVWRGSRDIMNLAVGVGSALVLGPPLVRGAESIYHSIEHLRKERIRARIEEAFDNHELSSAQKLQVLCDQFQNESLLVQMVQLLNPNNEALQLLNEDNFLGGHHPLQLPQGDQQQILWDFSSTAPGHPGKLSIYFKWHAQSGDMQAAGYIYYSQTDATYALGHPTIDLRCNETPFGTGGEQLPPILGNAVTSMITFPVTPQNHIDSLRTLLTGGNTTITYEDVTIPDTQVQLWQPED